MKTRSSPGFSHQVRGKSTLNGVTHEFLFRAPVWLFQGNAAWHFVTLPKDVSTQIKTIKGRASKAFGSVKVSAIIGQTQWKTSIFPDNKRAVYVLPIKAAVRRGEQLHDGVVVEVCIIIESAEA